MNLPSQGDSGRKFGICMFAFTDHNRFQKRLIMREELIT